MRLQLDSSISKPADSGPVPPSLAGSSPANRTPESAGSGDSIGISGPSAALGRLSAERAARIQQLTVAVRADTYRVSSSAVGKAIVAQAEV
ncbi:MAG: hypothetical protein ABUS49_04450 [Acidobacteriota bacterium]